jgi:cysteine-S-conjugate beta-lyase
MDSTTYNFDTLIDRRSTDSIKWNMYAEDVLPMWVADMDFPAPQAVTKAIQERAAHGIFGYMLDSLELRALIIERLKRLYNWEVKSEEILFIPGVVPALFLMGKAYARLGDNILMQTPVYPPFLGAPAAFEQGVNNVPLVYIREGNRIRYEIDFDQFEAAINPQTKVFMLCNPHNPIGREFTPDELIRLAEICQKHNVVICSDEIHSDLMLDGTHHTPTASLAPEIAANTITLMAPSKTFNLAGLGCSFAIVQNKDLHNKLAAAMMGLMPFVNIFGFVAATAAYRDGIGWLESLLGYLTANRDYVCDYVEKHLPGIALTKPQGTYLSWLDCRDLKLDDPYQFFIDHAKVAFSDGKMFGEEGQGFVRMNFACPRPTLTEALDRIREAVTNKM